MAPGSAMGQLLYQKYGHTQVLIYKRTDGRTFLYRYMSPYISIDVFCQGCYLGRRDCLSSRLISPIPVIGLKTSTSPEETPMRIMLQV